MAKTNKESSLHAEDDVRYVSDCREQLSRDTKQDFSYKRELHTLQITKSYRSRKPKKQKERDPCHRREKVVGRRI